MRTPPLLLIASAFALFLPPVSAEEKKQESPNDPVKNQATEPNEAPQPDSRTERVPDRPASPKRTWIGVATAGPWTADQEWTKFSQTVNVPAAAREMIFQVGLNGATGTLCVDAMEIQGVPRLAK